MKTKGRPKKKYYRIWKDGKFIRTTRPGVFAVITSQGVFGRLDCHSGKRAAKKNRVFVHDFEEGFSLGARPCRICKPQINDGYYRCLKCGTYIHWNTKSHLVSCRCSALRVDGNQYIVRVNGNHKDILWVGQKRSRGR